jgi:hypothetical protein
MLLSVLDNQIAHNQRANVTVTYDTVSSYTGERLEPAVEAARDSFRL